MDLLRNPFHILKASPRDNRRRILELADERSLLLNSNECIDARSCLTNPRKRLSAEVAWLPGLGPKRAGELLSLLESSPTELFAVDKLSSTARANLLAAGLARVSYHTPDDVAEWIEEIAWEFEEINAAEVVMVINEERVVSGFPEVSDFSAGEFEIEQRRIHYRKVIQTALKSLSSEEQVEAVTLVVESATNNGEDHGPVLIEDIVDAYEVEHHGSLEKEEDTIRQFADELRAALEDQGSDSVLASLVNQLINTVRQWDKTAQPIQVSTKSRGLDHEASHRIAGLVRSLAVHMFNEYEKLEFSQELTNMLQEVFAEVGEIAERIAEDISALDELAEHHEYRIIASLVARVDEIASRTEDADAWSELNERLLPRAKVLSETSEFKGLALFAYGLCLQVLGRDTEALAQFLQALEIEPESGRTLYAIARSQWALKQPSIALEYAEKAVNANPELPESWSLLATIHLNFKRKEEALFAARQSLDLDSSNADSEKVFNSLRSYYAEAIRQQRESHSPLESVYKATFTDSPRCEICGRRPAKDAVYRIHRGYVIARSTGSIEGTFCRDHSIQAYKAAQKGNLKGMWFSAGSLVVGAASALWDSAKLVDLPPEVVDFPFSQHLFGCPRCEEVCLESAGSHNCGRCGHAFNVGSCLHCGTFAVTNGETPQPISQCRKCSRSTPAGVSQRYSPIPMLIATAVEFSAVATPPDDGSSFFQRVAVKNLARQLLETDSDELGKLLVIHFDCTLRRRKGPLGNLAKETLTKKGLMHALVFSHRITSCVKEGFPARLNQLRSIAVWLDIESDFDEFLNQ